MADSPSSPADGATVTWRHDSTSEPWLRGLSMAAAAAVFGTYGALVLAALSMLVLTAAGGNVEILLLVGLFALLGGPVSLLYLWPLRDPEQRPSPYRGGTLWSFSPREVLALAATGIAVAALAFLIDPRLPFGLFLSGIAALVVVSVLSTEGRVDPESETIEARHREIDIGDVEAVRTYGLGPVVAVRPQGPGRAGSVPWYFLVPARDAEAVVDAVESGIEATPVPTPDRERNRTVQVVAGLLAVGAAAGGVLSLVAMDGVIGAYVGAIGVFGAGLFAFVAYEG